MKVTEEQKRLIEDMVRKNSGLNHMMNLLMNETQREIFKYYDRGCDILKLMERLAASDELELGIDINSREAFSYINESVKYFEDLYETIANTRKKINQERKDRKLKEISEAVDISKAKMKDQK